MKKDISSAMVQIKQTKSIRMLGDEKEVFMTIINQSNIRTINIPMKSVFQVKRGLESYIQKFYRRKTK